MCVSNKTWEGLDPDQKEILSKAVQKATEWNEINGMKYVDESLVGLADHGVEIVSLDPEEQKRWKTMMQSVYEEQNQEMKKLMEKIVK